MDDGFKDFTLPVLFKELDHIQAIVGRFDTFFLAMKQVCLAGVPALLSFSYAQKLGRASFLVLILPLAFLAFEVGYRYCFWVTYIDRVHDIAAYLNGRNVESMKIHLYQLTRVEKHDPKGLWGRFKRRVLTLMRGKERLLRSCKRFDFAFYGLVLLAAFIVCWFIPSDHSHVNRPCIAIVGGLFI